MKNKKLFESIGNIDDKFISEIVNEKKEYSRTFYLKRFIVAAFILCVTIFTSYTAHAMKIEREYNAAVGYLKSLGIEVEDLSSYSKKEIISIYDAYKKGENSESLDKILDNKEEKQKNDLTNVTREDVEKLQPNMTYKDVINILGETEDVGSGIYILEYKVDDKYILSIPFTSMESELGVYGKDLLKGLQPIE